MNESKDMAEREAILPAPMEDQEPKAPTSGRTTFQANGLDVTALGALASGILVLVSCLTCGQATYCLPFLPLVLGLIGLASARNALDPKRTRAWSWVGIGSGVATIVLIAMAMAAYVMFVLVLVAFGESR